VKYNNIISHAVFNQVPEDTSRLKATSPTNGTLGIGNLTPNIDE